MKNIVYIVAGLAAVGIMVAIVSLPSTGTTTETTLDVPAAASLVSATEPMTESGSLTFEVPSMHCQFACYPKVKETLEGTEGVTEVALAEQPEPNTLTVKKVIVKYDAGFDISQALASLKEKGFDDAVQIQ